MISIWHRFRRPPRDEYVLAITPRAMHYTNIGIVQPQGLINVFKFRDREGYTFLSEVKMWCRLPKDRENRKSEYKEEELGQN